MFAQGTEILPEVKGHVKTSMRQLYKMSIMQLWIRSASPNFLPRYCQIQNLSSMYFLPLAVLLLHRSSFLFVSAFFDPTIIDDQCFPLFHCDLDPVAAHRAISLIPNPALLPQEASSSSSSPAGLNPAIYRLPAIFEASPNAQVMVRLNKFKGLELTPQTFMTYLWPHASEVATRVLNKCTRQNPGLSGMSIPTLTWPGPPFKELQFFLMVTCQLDKKNMPGVTTYTPSGVQSGETIGGGRSIRRPGWGFKE